MLASSPPTSLPSNAHQAALEREMVRVAEGNKERVALRLELAAGAERLAQVEVHFQRLSARVTVRKSLTRTAMLGLLPTRWPSHRRCVPVV